MITVAPFQEAVDRMSSKLPVARALRSDEWSDVPVELRDRAFFTANFAQADLLQLMHEKLTRALELGREQVAKGERLVSRSSFIGDMKKALADSGYLPPQGKEGTIQDHSSRGRLGLIYDTNTRMAQEYGEWKVGQDPDILDAFPAQELIRWRSRKVPRNWIARWRDHGGKFFKGGRMIARKNDPIWVAISAFRNPYPPFDFNSGMGVSDVSRDQAEALGVIDPGEKIQPAHKGFNDTLERKERSTQADILEAAISNFAGSVEINKGIAKWRGFKTIPAPRDVSVDDAIDRLQEGFSVKDSEGEEIVFGQRVLAYFGQASGKKDDRLKSLAWAEAAVLYGTKSVLDDRIVYTQAFETLGKPKGFVTLVSLPSGEVFNFYRKPANKMLSTKPAGSPRSAPLAIKSLPTSSEADPNFTPPREESKP